MAKLPMYWCQTCIRQGHISDTDTNMSSMHPGRKNHFLIQLFYFDFECCLFELFLWVSSLFELFYLYFKRYLLSLN